VLGAVARLSPMLAWSGALGTGLLALAMVRSCCYRPSAPGGPEVPWRWRVALAAPLVGVLLCVGLYPQPALDALQAGGRGVLRCADANRAVIERAVQQAATGPGSTAGPKAESP
jgi:NADH:ubiquinone oxidoreductase subunit 4 (subunit M)